MQILISARLTQDLAAIVHAAFASHGIVNVPKIAERVRGRHESENVALEDIAELVMRQAERIGAPMEFSSPIASTDQPVKAVNNAGASTNGRLLDSLVDVDRSGTGGRINMLQDSSWAR